MQDMVRKLLSFQNEKSGAVWGPHQRHLLGQHGCVGQNQTLGLGQEHGYILDFVYSLDKCIQARETPDWC